MGLKDRLSKAEKATKAGRELRQLEEIFLCNMRYIRGETDSPHPRSSDPEFTGTSLSTPRAWGGGDFKNIPHLYD